MDLPGGLDLGVYVGHCFDLPGGLRLGPSTRKTRMGLGESSDGLGPHGNPQQEAVGNDKKGMNDDGFWDDDG